MDIITKYFPDLTEEQRTQFMQLKDLYKELELENKCSEP